MNGPHSLIMENCISYWWTNLLYINNFYPELQYQVSIVFETLFFKGTLPGLRQLLVTDRPLKMMKNAFYFVVKALLVLKIFKILF